ncbi:MAG: hypothetical protein HGB04_00500 [Chlorobiaceae bacterium]|nr:hypothetical protein [Chlorobiaceae bacterium]
MANNTLRTIVVGSALLTAGLSGNAAAQTATGTSSLTVTVPDVIILDYCSKLNLSITSAAGELLTNETADDNAFTADMAGGSASGSGLSGVKTSAFAGLNGSATFTASKVWAVRGFSPSGNVKVKVTGPLAGVLTKNGSTSNIGVTNIATLTSGGGSTETLQLAGLTPVYGDIRVALDFANTKTSGAYSGDLTISAQTL